MGDSTNNSQHLLLTNTILDILAHWNIAESDQILLLALPSKTKPRHFPRFRNESGLPLSAETSERIAHLLGIADALRTTFPRNQLMSKLWLRQPHRRFYQKAPLTVMLEGGMSGIIEVRAELDCAFDWEQDDQRQQDDSQK